MANINDEKQNQSSASELNARRQDETHDPEFEMPDPEQVDRDIKEAERVYGSDAKKSDKPGTGKDKVA